MNELPATINSHQPSGSTLISLLVAVTISAYIAAGLVGLAYVNSSSSIKLTNKCDSINAARTCLDRIGRQVRMARSVGSLYGDCALPTAPTVDNGVLPPGASTNTNAVDWSQVPIQNITSGTADISSTGFPGPADPFYGNVPLLGTGVPPGGWPDTSVYGSAWAKLNSRPYYTLSPTCLVIQIPVFDSGGLPVGIPYPTAAAPVANIECLDSYVYQVVPDTGADAIANSYKLVECKFPAQGVPRPTGYDVTTIPQTLLRGIIGPVDPSSGSTIPKVFSFISRIDNQAYDTISNPPSASRIYSNQTITVNNVSGICINLEILRQTAGTSRTSSLQFKTEVYMRNNSSLTD